MTNQEFLNQLPEVVKKSTQLANLAYSKPQSIYSNLKENNYTDFEWVDNKKSDTQAILCVKEDDLFIIFRGTEFTNLWDWLTNLDCRFHNMKQWGKVHNGFHQDALSVLDQVLKYLDKYHKNKKISVGGHSQGAGDASSMARILENEYFFDHCVSVAEPRNSSPEAAEKFGRACGHKIHRIVNNNDIVTRVPMRAMGYKHIVDVNLSYFKENRERVCDISFWEEFKDRISGHIEDIGQIGTDGITDHYPQTYEDLVCGKLAQVC